MSMCRRYICWESERSCGEQDPAIRLERCFSVFLSFFWCFLGFFVEGVQFYIFFRFFLDLYISFFNVFLVFFSF